MTNSEAIEWFKNSAFYHKDHTPFNMAISALERERQGHWINNHTQCSICEWGMEDDTVGKPITVNFPYCPNCGAKMSE